MSNSPEFRTRATDLLDEQEAYVNFGDQFTSPDLIMLPHPETKRRTPARKAAIAMARGHMAFLRELGLRISCGISYGSLFDSASPGVRNVFRWGNMSDADILLVFQSNHMPHGIDSRFIKPEPGGFLYHAQLPLPKNPHLSELSITGITPGYALHALNELRHLCTASLKGVKKVYALTAVGNSQLPIQYVIEKKKWLLDALTHRAFYGIVPSQLRHAFAQTNNSFSRYQIAQPN